MNAFELFRAFSSALEDASESAESAEDLRKEVAENAGFDITEEEAELFLKDKRRRKR